MKYHPINSLFSSADVTCKTFSFSLLEILNRLNVLFLQLSEVKLHSIVKSVYNG
jgi:hypothetical protein